VTNFQNLQLSGSHKKLKKAAAPKKKEICSRNIKYAISITLSWE
jgi:hypothetical protein